MATRAPRKFLLRRSKDNLTIIFARRARRVGNHPLGQLQAVASTRPGRINIKNIEETELRGTDFFEIVGVRFNHWWTQNWDASRNLIQQDVRVASHTTRNDVINEINILTGYTIQEAAGDEGGSGLSSVGGTSVVSFRMESVNYALEDGTGNLLYEDDDTFVSEELNTVIQRNDGTFLSVDTRSVSHGGGSAGNPVVSGAVSDDTLTLTLDDSSTVDIDVTSLNNGTETTIGLPNWYRTYANAGTGDSTPGAQVSTLQESRDANPFYYGVTLKRGREFAFDHATDSNANYLGIWGGSTSYTPSAAGNRGLWDKVLKRNNASLDQGTDDYDSKGFDFTADYSLTQGSSKLVLQYDYDTNKLKLWDVTYDHWYLITTASVAEDGNPIIISSALPQNGVLSTFTDRESVWHLIAEATSGVDTTWRDGFKQDSVWQHNVGLHPGEKMVTTTHSAWSQSFPGFGYSGASIGQSNVQNEMAAVLKFTAQEKIEEKAGFTINTNAIRYDTDITTAEMGGAKISFRYHLDNSFDVFDEDNEEVLFTKDANFDGSTQYLQMGFTGDVSNSSVPTDWTFEPFAATWFYNPNNRDKTLKANKRHVGTDGPGTQIQWGEKMYPGQELIFQENQGGSGNTYIGIRNSDNSDWTKNLQLDGTNVTTTASGFDITSNYAVNNKWMALRYDYGDHKLKLYDTNTTGVETLITAATVAEDGNAIRIAVSGNNYIPGASTLLRYYGWEFIHTTSTNPQPWKNWRCDRPSANSRIGNDTTLRQRRALIPGYYMRWTTANSQTSNFIGGWKSSNAATGLTNVDSQLSLWDWGFRLNNSEQVIDLQGMSFNTSNPNYTGGGNPLWADPDKGTTVIQLRYNSDNSFDLYDVTNSAVIATKDSNLDGSAFYVANGIGTNLTDLTDNFFSGGDPIFGTL